jgi:hypothetical protein
MTATVANLDPALQALVDDRLDAIDRVLLRAGVSRGERRDIVEEVEAQIHELLARKSGGESSRADVLAVLGTLDPPEAYAPEPYRHRVQETVERPAVRIRRPQPSLLALGSAAGAVLCCLLTVVLGLLIVQNGIDEIGLILGALLLPIDLAVTACGIAAIVRIRRSEGWLFGLRAALFAAAVFPLIMGNAILVIAALLFETLGIVFIAGLAVMVCNAVLVYQTWKLVASDYRRATPEPF